VPDTSAIAGFLIGLAFGGLGLLTGFCLLSGLRDWWTANDGRKLRSFALALAVAIAGTQALAATGTVEIGKSLYLQPTFSAPLRAIMSLKAPSFSKHQALRQVATS